ncbi:MULTISPECIES: ATP-binding cassette domain-containing protein [unclassified Actinomyces]|uniref:ATP-binding cassette domain-containing protein n=1 Tax=unclassified Actinomyces TaxID=2609248 RepID=UPI0020177FA9|nr:MULTISPECIES: ATP-binding cassette domain-containing protein [unclassified Actinomyces]MCL3778625.1 ATP-binding cassette domain-containing protein [Actinomyces sp. AC-20-1]MCL3790894.1 ATP-binding cassette domain-containing protein [Actinomyces sp. 187325]MCL3793149.1 ATP-binding cassette domain-containing protein [Actinomyces sp. 186855]MCL3795502.1 ATP-binding cassette domain-containing protein [Actinomyces sp. 217892]
MSPRTAHPLLEPRRVLEGLGAGPALHLQDVGYAYGPLARRRSPQYWPLHDVSLALRPGVVTGLLGRNGAGKSTLLDVAAGLRRPARGTVTLTDVDAEARPTGTTEQVWDTAAARAATCLLGTRRALPASLPVSTSIRLWEATRPLWSTQDAHRYLRLFDLDADARPARLSQGQRSAVDAAFALASHCPVLLLDEVHLGMDAVVRRRFWDALLEQYAAERPTIVIASHEVGEVADLLEDVVVLAGGTVAASGDADALREACTPASGPLADLTDVLEHYSQAPATDRQRRVP